MRCFRFLWASVLVAVTTGQLSPTVIPVGEIARSNFSPLSCYNPAATCTSFSNKNYTLSQKVTVPCGECLIFDYPDGQVTTFQGGLDIQGKLVFPLNKKGTIETPFVHVQGALEISNDELVSSQPSLSFVLTGTSDVLFTPNSQNSDACGGGSCNTGKKSIVVAGGQLDISGLKDGCPTWVNLIDAIPDASTSTPSTFPQLPVPPATCSREIVTEGFESGSGKFKSSLGATGSIQPGSHDGSNYYSVSGRSREWQGPFVALPQYDRDCIIPDQTYLVRAKYRLVPEANNTYSNCHANGTHCLSLGLHTMASDETMKWRSLYDTPAIARSHDGTWTDLYALIDFRSTELQSDGKYQMLYFSGPEAGVKIDIDDVQILLPTQDMYPDPNGGSGICSNLIINGDASLDNVIAYPFVLDSTRLAHLSVESELVNGVPNPYFHITGRTTIWTSIAQDLIIGCISKDVGYNFNARVRVNSLRDVQVRMTLRTYSTYAPVNPGYVTESIGVCPLTSAHIGWVECSAKFMFDTLHAAATKMTLSFVVENELYADVDYDDISVTLDSSPVNKFVVAPEVASCWSTGASILQTSHSIDQMDQNVLEITNVATDAQGNTVLSLDKSIDMPTTSTADSLVATEIALLSRNVEITGANDDPVNTAHGANVMILRTENVAQKIQGVKFTQMGQQGIQGRFPLLFHLSGDVDGSLVSKNSIVDSNQRCLVIQGTHKVTVEHNVAYNNFGHCFVLQDGIEQDNNFNYNLGAGTKAMPTTGIISIAESDMFPATFLISNPKNNLLGNVAAGSDDSGFWYELSDSVRGPSEELDLANNINPSTTAFGTFKDCVSHSNTGDGFKIYPNGYFPTGTRALIDNLKSYRNNGSGSSIRSASNVGIVGGYYADNRKQIDIDDNCEDITVQNAVVHGFTPLYQNQVSTASLKSHCPAWRPISGLQLHSHLRYRDSKGFVVQNTAFDYFGDDSGCMNSVALDIDSSLQDGHFAAYSSFDGLTFGNNVNSTAMFSACKVANELSFGQDLAIHDKLGSLNPNNPGNAGWLVSNSVKMSAFISTCTLMPDACVSYCEGACFRDVTFSVPPSKDYDSSLVLEVTDSKGNVTNFYGHFDTYTKEESGSIVKDEYDNYIYNRRIYFTAILPGGETYSITFKKANSPYWPQFTEIRWGDVPDCTGYPDENTVTFLETSPSQSECDSIIRNPGGETGFHNFWVHTGGGVQVISGTAGNEVHSGSYAISSVARLNTFHGPGQFLDTRCMTVGQQYEVMVHIRIRDYNGNYFKCNINAVDYLANDACPRVSLRMKSTDGNTTYAYPVATALGPWKAETWNKLYGILTVTQSMADAETILLFIDRVRPGMNIIIDDVVVQKLFQGCAMPIYNSDFEAGDTRYWYHHGATEIDMYSPGLDSNYALRTFNRRSFWSSMAQDLNRGCMILGNEYDVSAMFVLLNDADDTPFDCDPAVIWGNGILACPTMSLQITTGGVVTDIDIGSVSPEYVNGGWNGIYGQFTATEDIMNADTVMLYFRKFHDTLDLLLDDVVITNSVPSDPNQIISNGDLATGDSRYFNHFNGGNIFVDLPGYDGENDFSLKVTGRTQFYYGVSQAIDNSVLLPNRLYKFKAQVQLFTDDTLTQAFKCDPASGHPSKRCPFMKLRSQNLREAPTYRIVSAAPATWVVGDWNLYEAAVEIMPYEMDADSLQLVISDAPQGIAMILDNIEFRLVDHLTEAPTITPTISPTSGMPSSTPSLNPSTSQKPSFTVLNEPTLA